MAKPTAAYSVRLRVRMENVPGALGRLAIAIGDAGANIVALDGFEAKLSHLVEDVIVNCNDVDHIESVRHAVTDLDHIELLEWDDRTFALHDGGKIETVARLPLNDNDDLSMAYTPGVARVCSAIAEDPDRVHDLTIKKNTVAIVTDGTAVLGLGNIGPAAALPVMEGKALLFKNFAEVDAFPVCLDVSRHDENLQAKIDAIVETVECIAPVYGGINLEDIAAPQCFEIEERLKESLDIPVFHDDQHGTAVVVLAALRNALRIVNKRMQDLRVVIAGAGAAGVAIATILGEAGVPHIVGADRKGAIHPGRDDLNIAKQRLAQVTNPDKISGSLADILPGADVFVGVSGPGLITAEDLRTMADDPIVFALANPEPEIRPETTEGVAAVLATGRSDYPNQINNVLAFPGIFKGAFEAGATQITEGMKLAAATAIASAVPSDELSADCIVPSVFEKRVVEFVAHAVADEAAQEGITRQHRPL